jgi:hypothetical protein
VEMMKEGKVKVIVDKMYNFDHIKEVDKKNVIFE